MGVLEPRRRSLGLRCGYVPVDGVSRRSFFERDFYMSPARVLDNAYTPILMDYTRLPRIKLKIAPQATFSAEFCVI